MDQKQISQQCLWRLVSCSNLFYLFLIWRYKYSVDDFIPPFFLGCKKCYTILKCCKKVCINLGENFENSRGFPLFSFHVNYIFNLSLSLWVCFISCLKTHVTCWLSSFDLLEFEIIPCWVSSVFLHWIGDDERIVFHLFTSCPYLSPFEMFSGVFIYIVNII